jgi:hypothetical protein
MLKANCEGGAAVSDTFLMIFKFMAVLATVVFSVLAVFAEDKQKNRLTQKGRIALVTALVSGTIAFTTQAFELMADRTKAAKAQAETQELLRNIQRGVYPLFGPSLLVGANWKIPISDPALNTYRVRLTRETQSILHDYKPGKDLRGGSSEFVLARVDEHGKRTGEGVSFGKASPLFPRADERIAKTALADFGVELNFYIKGSDLVSPNLHLRADSGGNVELEFRPSDLLVEVSAENMLLDLGDFRSDGKIVSLADLSEATVDITFKDIPEVDAAILRIWKSESLQHAELLIGSRRFFIANMKRLAQDEYPTYRCRLPKSMEYKSDPNIICG